jgi:hypothetical protein
VVEYRKKDPQSGTAIGAIQVSSETGKTLFVPFIIKKFELYPLDIWMEAQTQNVHPLTNDTFKEQFFTRAIADALDQRPFDAAGQYFNDPSLWTSNYPPLQGRYSYASGGYQILDQIEDTMTREHWDIFKKSLEKHAYALMNYKKGTKGQYELISKLAQKKIPAKNNTNDFATSAAKLIPVGAASIKREGYDKYSVISMADQLFDLSGSEYMNREDCARFLSKIYPKPWEFLHEVDQEGEKLVVVKPAPEKGVFLYDDMRDRPEAANEFAVYDVKNQMGMHMLGVVFPYVVGFDGKKKNQKLFISSENSTMQGNIAGIKRENSDYFLKLFRHPKACRVGQTGTFIFIDDGKAIATVPVTIKAIEGHGPITAITMDGQKIKIKRSWGDDNVMEPASPAMKKKPNFLDAHGMVEVRPKEYVIPRRMTWFPMEGFRDVSSTAEEWMNKEAALHMEMDPMVVRWTGIVYDISGSGMDKVSLDERQTKLLLATRGATIEKVAQIIKKARAAGRVKVHNLQPLRKKADIIKYAADTYQSLEKICAELRCDFVKEAAEIDDAMTVDALLSLGFINPENLSKFVSFKPVFEKVMDYLAELTLACRLGLKDLNESALVTVLGRLGEVIEGLKKVENGLKKPGIKTASASCPACKKKGCECGGKCDCCKEFVKEHEKKFHKESAVKSPHLWPKSLRPAKGSKLLDKGHKALTGAGAAAGLYTALKPRHHKEAAAKDKTHVPPAGMSTRPTQEGNPFADGMVDGEMEGHMYLERWRNDPKAMLAYLNGKRTAEMNKATTAMGAGFQPPNGLKPQKPQAPAKPAKK